MTEILEHTTIEERRISLGDCPVDLMDLDRAVAIITGSQRADDQTPLAVASVNLDHVHHFGNGGRWHGVLEQSDSRGSVHWLSLLDGAPLVARAEQITGRRWPRLAGSDLTLPVLEAAQERGLSVGFLGGSSETHERLRALLTRTRPQLRTAGCWSPSRAVLEDTVASRRLADEIRRARTDILFVGLGKPRQELWIAEHGHLTGASALLAFGAAADFLAGRVSRAPAWMAKHGLEWSYRLALEPKRLSRRYLVEGPVAFARLQRRATDTAKADAHLLESTAFVGAEQPADITVIVVTHNNAASIEPLLADLRRESGPFRLRVVVADNHSTDATPDILTRHPDVIADPGPNNGYAAGINRGLRHVAQSRAVLIVNADLRLAEGAILELWQRVWQPGVGAAVPTIVDDAGEVRRSLRFEPTALRTLGDALFGDRFDGRPMWLTETDHNDESYAHPHPIEWATGAAMLIRAETVAEVGDWDERYFLYSEEVDYLRRVRSAGWTTWFEPGAVVRHGEGGSGGPQELHALMAVNRVRYVEAHRGHLYAEAVRAAASLGAALRARAPEQRRTLTYLLARGRWHRLPAAESSPAASEPPSIAGGSIVIPAHDEASVILRTLAPLGPYAAEGRLEVLVATNGCSDATVDRAREVEGVRVLDLAVSSKVAALNAADSVARGWPRLYLDADIEITPRAVADVLAALADGKISAARPPFRYDTTGASWPVRAFYRARGRLPETQCHLWGAGVYGLTRAGRRTFGAFPAVTADDLFVDQLFSADQKAVIDTDPVVVRTPRDLRSLLTVLRRTTAGNRELARHGGEEHASATLARTLGQLAVSMRSPLRTFDAIVYAAAVAAARLPLSSSTWGRDESSRTAAQPLRRLESQLPSATTSPAPARPSAPIPTAARIELPTTRVI